MFNLNKMFSAYSLTNKNKLNHKTKMVQLALFIYLFFGMFICKEASDE